MILAMSAWLNAAALAARDEERCSAGATRKGVS